MYHFSLGVLKYFLFVFNFQKFDYLCMDIFGLIFFGIHLVSWICSFISFARFGEFSAIVSSSTFSAPLSPHLPSHQWTWMLDYLLQFHKPLSLFPFFGLFSLYSSNWVIFIVYLQVHWFCPLSYPFWCWAIHSNFNFSCCISQF